MGSIWRGRSKQTSDSGGSGRCQEFGAMHLNKKREVANMPEQQFCLCNGIVYLRNSRRF